MTEPGNGSFGAEAAEMANETEVEVPAEGTSAPADATTEVEVEPTADSSTAADDEVGDAEQAEPDDVVTAPSPEAQLAERTSDLQRLQAEYANYRKRVERDRQLISENATYRVLGPIIEVIDTIDLAREHVEVAGGFKTVADQLELTVSNLGLTRFGEPGDAFDPNLHEALSHMGTDPEVEVITCRHIAKAGYKIGDRVVRAAQVLVVDPVED